MAIWRSFHFKGTGLPLLIIHSVYSIGFAFVHTRARHLLDILKLFRSCKSRCYWSLERLFRSWNMVKSQKGQCLFCVVGSLSVHRNKLMETSSTWVGRRFLNFHVMNWNADFDYPD